MLFYFTSEQNEISLIVKGSDKRENFINDGFYLDPSEVIVNRERRYGCQKFCYFESSEYYFFQSYHLHLKYQN